MKYLHFIAFASEMFREEMGALADTDAAEDKIESAKHVEAIARAVVEAVNAPYDDEQRLEELANEIGMYEHIEAWADDSEFVMHEFAINYVS